MTKGMKDKLTFLSRKTWLVGFLSPEKNKTDMKSKGMILTKRRKRSNCCENATKVSPPFAWSSISWLECNVIGAEWRSSGDKSKCICWNWEERFESLAAPSQLFFSQFLVYISNFTLVWRVDCICLLIPSSTLLSFLILDSCCVSCICCLAIKVREAIHLKTRSNLSSICYSFGWMRRKAKKRWRKGRNRWRNRRKKARNRRRRSLIKTIIILEC